VSNLLKIDNWREWLIGLVAVCAVGVVSSLSPIPQDPSYHQFADIRMIFGIQNCLNVLSNLSFVLVGIIGLRAFFKKKIIDLKYSYLIFCAGIFFVGIGSSYYHYDPNPETLVWDRLPMTIAFMALFSMVVSDRISAKLGSQILWPLLIAGIASVCYWYWSEKQGRGDLRAYVIIQFLPMILIPIVLILYRSKLMVTSYLWGTLATYFLAKVAEHFDLVIYDSVGWISGHSIKHILGAVAVLWVIFAFETTKPNFTENSIPTS
jgi:hypothetical protein